MQWLFFWAIIGAFVGALVGERKGRRGEGAALGAILGPLGWLLIALGPDYKAERERTESRKCPFCAELVKREAKVCKHCGRDLAPEPNEKEAQTKNSIHLLIMILSAIVGFIAVALISTANDLRKLSDEQRRASGEVNRAIDRMSAGLPTLGAP